MPTAYTIPCSKRLVSHERHRTISKPNRSFGLSTQGPCNPDFAQLCKPKYRRNPSTERSRNCPGSHSTVKAILQLEPGTTVEAPPLLAFVPCRGGPKRRRSQVCLGYRPATHSSAWAMSICICANISAECPGQTASFFPKSSLCKARIPSSNTGRPQLDPAPQAAPTFWNAVAAHPWLGGCGVRGPPPRSSSWGPTCCRPPSARASARSAGFGLSPVERPTGRWQQGARGSKEEARLGAPPNHGAGPEGAWRRDGGGKGARRCYSARRGVARVPN